MNLELSATDREFRDDVRRFIAESFTLEMQEESSRQSGVFAEGDLARRWHRALFEKGWVAPAWPEGYGGPGWSFVQRYIFESECADAGTPILPAFGHQLCGPVIIGRGSDAQRDYFLPKILSGEHYWCQGFSEPGAGSDLAGLQLRADRDGDLYRLNGTKIWTTHAHHANWIFVLARTTKESRRQAGINFLLVDMSSPGITVRPIISISGEHELNQVFFDDVEVPEWQRVGEEGQGWSVTKYLLEHERGGGDWIPRIKRVFRELRRFAAKASSSDAAFIKSAPFRDRLAKLEIDAAAVEMTELRLIANISTGSNTGDALASMLKLMGSETYQKLTELLLEAVGLYALPYQSQSIVAETVRGTLGSEQSLTATARYLNGRATTIYGGSSEIQRNIMARAALGL